MQELLVGLEPGADLGPIRALATIMWPSELLPVLAVAVADASLAGLPSMPARCGLKQLKLVAPWGSGRMAARAVHRVHQGRLERAIHRDGPAG